MLESLEVRSDRVRFNPGYAEGIIPAIDAHGRIRLPGFPPGLSIESYLPLVHLYTRILEANRLLDRYRPALRLGVSVADVSDQAPLTPLTPSRQLHNLHYKREDLTATRAYKVRGALAGMAKLMDRGLADTFIAVSTGNHALGVLKAAELLQPRSIRIVVPKNTANAKLRKIAAAITELRMQGVDANLETAGRTFDEARAWTLQAQERTGETYLDPYSDPWVVAGQGTIGLELTSQIAPLLERSDVRDVVLITPVGGGGLLTGTATALRFASAWDPAFRNVTIRFLGLRLNNQAAELGDAIRVTELADCNRTVLEALNIPFRGIDDPQIRAGLEFTDTDLGHRVEGASAATVWPVLSEPDYTPGPGRLVISLLSGANV